MSSGMAVRCLIKNTWYISSTGFGQGYVYLYGSRVEDVGEGEPPPEYELAELLYDFEGDALVAHGYSLLVDIVEFPVRGLEGFDLSVFTREELKKLARIGVVNAYINGVTLPVAITSHPEVIADVARESGMRIGIVAARGTAPRLALTPLLEVEDGWLYYEDRRIGRVESSICSPGNVAGDCLLVDARGYGNTLTAVEEVYRGAQSPEQAYRTLTNFYRITGVDSGYVDKNSASDLVVYDLKNPLKSIPVTSPASLYSLLRRAQQPDIVFVGGDVFFERGENLAIPLTKVNDLLKQRLGVTAHASRQKQ